MFEDLIRLFYEKYENWICSLESSVNSSEVVTTKINNVPRGKASACAASFQVISEHQFKNFFKFQKLSTLEMGKVRQPLK